MACADFALLLLRYEHLVRYAPGVIYSVIVGVVSRADRLIAELQNAAVFVFCKKSVHIGEHFVVVGYFVVHVAAGAQPQLVTIYLTAVERDGGITKIGFRRLRTELNEQHYTEKQSGADRNYYVNRDEFAGICDVAVEQIFLFCRPEQRNVFMFQLAVTLESKFDKFLFADLHAVNSDFFVADIYPDIRVSAIAHYSAYVAVAIGALDSPKVAADEFVGAVIYPLVEISDDEKNPEQG